MKTTANYCCYDIFYYKLITIFYISCTNIKTTYKTHKIWTLTYLERAKAQEVIT